MKLKDSLLELQPFILFGKRHSFAKNSLLFCGKPIWRLRVEFWTWAAPQVQMHRFLQTTATWGSTSIPTTSKAPKRNTNATFSSSMSPLRMTSPIPNSTSFSSTAFFITSTTRARTQFSPACGTGFRMMALFTFSNSSIRRKLPSPSFSPKQIAENSRGLWINGAPFSKDICRYTCSSHTRSKGLGSLCGI